MGELGNHYHHQYGAGIREVIAALEAEEANLLHARCLARTHGWWDRIISTMQGLRSLYDHTGRGAEWRRLVEEIVPDFVDPATDGPLPGREDEWSLVTEYRVRLAREARQWAEAERLQRVCVDWDRRRAAGALQLKPEALDDAQRNAVRTLAASLHELGQIQRELQQPECVVGYEEALVLAERISDRAGAAICALNLGHAYKDIPAIHDLARADRGYRRALQLFDERDRLGCSKCYDGLGAVARERFAEARDPRGLIGRIRTFLFRGWSKAKLLRHINACLHFYHQALKLIPANAVGDLAVAHHQLGNTYHDTGDIDRALSHWRESIRLEENQGNLYGAAQTRYNVAVTLAQSGRLRDAREYARAALRNFETYDKAAREWIDKTKQLIAEIDQAIAKGPSS